MIATFSIMKSDMILIVVRIAHGVVTIFSKRLSLIGSSMLSMMNEQYLLTR